MQSPKFQFLQHNLQSVFSKHNLLEEWNNRVRAQIRKQLVFDAIEYRDLHDQKEKIASQLSRELVEGRYSVKEPKRYLAEKSRGLCRQMTLIHPKDLLVLERLSRSLYFELKQKAPSRSAFFEPDDGNFAKGFKPSDFEYGSFASWKRFQKQVFGFADENKYVVITDVANFYDFINFQHLRNIIASLASLREEILDLLIFVLNRLTWTPDFMPLSQVGMPQIETSATRVLANAMLYEVDKVCETHAQFNYARFMDDMDIGVDTITDAKTIIRDVDLTLQSRQLRLNSSKTMILSSREAYKHFCVKENAYLVRLGELVDKGRHLPIIKKILSARYEEWINRSASGGVGSDSRFKLGNGQKIHKFILSLMHEIGAQPPENDLLWLIKHEPAMRSSALKYLAFSKRNNSNFATILKMIRDGVFVDDAAFVDVAGYLLHARFVRTAKCIDLVREFCSMVSIKSDFGLHATIFVAAKFLSRKEVLLLLKNNIERISGDFWLSRAAAGVAPIFFATSEWAAYHKAIIEIDSDDANDVLKYLIDVSNLSKYSISLRGYLNAANNTFPQNLYFPKVLILLASSKNPNISRIIPNMHMVHPALKRDQFFSNMGF